MELLPVRVSLLDRGSASRTGDMECPMDSCRWLAGAEVSLPVPDLSMTYNALCLGGIALSYVLGGLANLALRRPVAKSSWTK
jgi:hypothetical protein